MCTRTKTAQKYNIRLFTVSFTFQIIDLPCVSHRCTDTNCNYGPENIPSVFSGFSSRVKGTVMAHGQNSSLVRFHLTNRWEQNCTDINSKTMFPEFLHHIQQHLNVIACVIVLLHLLHKDGKKKRFK